MVTENEITELFDTLNLQSEERRISVLSQGVICDGIIKKTLWIATDNVTKPQDAVAYARLE
jgi:hypothetical protein